MKITVQLQKIHLSARNFLQNIYLFSAAMEVDEFDLLERRVRVLEARISSLHSKKE